MAAGLAAASILLTAGAVVWGVFQKRTPVSPVADFVAAVGTIRPVEGRLTGGFAYGAYGGPRRTGRPESGPPLPVLVAAERLRLVARSSPGDGRLAVAAGVARLVTGDIDAAIREIEDVAARATVDALANADLAAAYLARSASRDAPVDAVRALEAAERAVAADATVVEAWFNRALALERVGPRSAVAQAWLDYLAHDTSSPWATEARRRRSGLRSEDAIAWEGTRRRLDERPIPPAVAREAVANHPDGVRGYVDDELLVSWAECVDAAGVAGCGARLDAAEHLAGELHAQRGDATVRDIVAGVRTASLRGARRVAEGLRLFARVRRLFDEGGVDRAAEPLAAAIRLLGISYGAPEYLDFYLAYRDYYRGALGAAATRLARVSAIARQRGHLFVAARSDMVAATAALRSARFDEGLELRLRSARNFTAAGERAYAASAWALAGEDLEAMGDLDEAWRTVQRALLISEPGAQLRSYYLVMAAAALLARSQGLHRAEFVYAAEAERAVAGSADAALTTATALDLALAHNRLGDVPRARAMLTQAHDRLARVPDATVVPQFETEIADTHARIASRDLPELAVAAYTSVLEGLPGSGSIYRFAETLLERGRAHRRTGRSDLAASDWRRGLEYLEDERSGVREEQLRISHLAQGWDLFGELADLLATDAGDRVEALRVTERGRARALLDSLAPGQEGPRVDLERLTAQLDPRTAVLVYLALPQRLMTWVLTTDRIQLVLTDTSRSSLERSIHRWRERIVGGAPADGLDEELHGVLVEPVTHLLPRNGTLLVVPDGAIGAVPFSALRSRDGLLVDRYAIGIAPSLALLDLEGGRPSAAPQSVLALGDPAFARAAGRDLQRLPGAAAEARAVAARYAKSVTVVGADATPDRLLEGLRTHDVVHYAGHAVANEAYPSRSALLLAPGEGDGILFPAQIAAVRRARTRLVVLSACGTAEGRMVRGEGALSLARPFMAAGVPTVVATLWPTVDRVNEMVLSKFHDGVAGGADVRDALRDAQRWLRAWDGGRFDEPRYWASIVCLGGGLGRTQR